MTFEHQSKNKILLIAISIVLLLGGGLLFARLKQGETQCTLEAKLCPDGSSVGRIGPDCGFAPCPGEDEDCRDGLCGLNGSENNGWKKARDGANGIEFSFPEELGAKYVFTNEWPPKASLRPGNFECKETAPESSLPERTARRLVDDRVYCVSVKTEAAAGTAYSSYKYSSVYGGKIIDLEFSLRFPNCGNYDEARAAECAAEREAFDLDSVVDRIVRSMVFTE